MTHLAHYAVDANRIALRVEFETIGRQEPRTAHASWLLSLFCLCKET